MSVNKQKLIVILGPTASGKSDLGVNLAKIFNGEIISADSRQVYRGLDIGSGKINKKDMQDIPHYLLDIVSPRKQFSVSEYQRLAEKVIAGILKRGKLPMLVGGSGMYIDAVLYGAPYPEVPPNKKLRTILEKKSLEDLMRILKIKDSSRAKTIDQHNKRRIIRALEIIATTKKPIPQLIKIPRFDILMLGVDRTKKELERRIMTRLEKRLHGGMVQEVKKLLKDGISYTRLYDLGLEYRFVSEYLRDKLTKKEMVEKLFHAILQYSKRQKTWFRQYHKIIWIRTSREAKKYIRLFLKKNRLYE